MTTDERFENIERELKQTKCLNRYLLGALVLAVTVGIMGAMPWDHSKVIRASKFIIEDKNGKVLGAFGPIDNMPGLFLADTKGTPRVLLVETEKGPALTFKDENAKNRLVLASLTDDLGPVGSGLSLNDKDQNPRAALFLSNDGPDLTMFYANRSPCLTLGIWKGKGQIQIGNNNQKVIWSAP